MAEINLTPEQAQEIAQKLKGMSQEEKIALGDKIAKESPEVIPESLKAIPEDKLIQLIDIFMTAQEQVKHMPGNLQSLPLEVAIMKATKEFE